MVKYDKFEVFMIGKMNEWAKMLDEKDNRTSVEVFSELMETLYQYEKLKDCGDIIAD